MTNKRIRRFFAGGITSKGFVQFYDSSWQHLKRVYILKGGPGTGKSTMIEQLSDRLANDVPERWHIHAAKDPGTLDGLVIPGTIAVVDGDWPHVIEPLLPGVVGHIVYLGNAWDAEKLGSQKNEIIAANEEEKRAFDLAFDHFAEALRVHDDWEAIYINNMDFAKANQLTKELGEQFFGDLSLNKRSRIDHRYLGAATPEGAVDFIPNLTEDVGQRYFIKGRPGCGKSTMLKQLAKEAESRGFDVEIYHCGFDPDSLDMLVLRELDVAIFDSTAPHEHFPSRASDVTVDMYARCMAPNTDERNKDAIAEVSRLYKQNMQEATRYLARAREAHGRLKAIYGAAMDFAQVDRITEQIYEEIKGLL